MNHKGTQILSTDRLVLRRIEISDAEKMYANWASDSSVTKFLTWLPHENVEATKKVITSWVEEYEKKDFYQWVIILKDIGEPIGTISVVGKDESVNMLHIGYCIGSKWWRRGYASEALSAVIDFLFDEVGAERIESTHDVNNPSSGRVMEKCGMKYEGTLRRYARSNAGISDVKIYSILSGEKKQRR